MTLQGAIIAALGSISLHYRISRQADAATRRACDEADCEDIMFDLLELVPTSSPVTLAAANEEKATP